MRKPYPSYKNSGVEWIGEIPETWKMKKLKYTIKNIITGIWGNEPIDDDNDLKCVRVNDFDYEKLSVKKNEYTTRNIIFDNGKNQSILQKNDLLIEKSGGGEKTPVGRVVIYNNKLNEKSVCSNFIAVLRSELDKYDSKFLVYLHSKLYAEKINTRSIKQTTGIQNLDLASYLSERIAIPDVIEQQQIVSFLDNRTRLIEELIDKTKQKIELLKEKRISLINHSVTKGLNSDVEMKDSGIEWIGKIPTHWKISKFKYDTITPVRYGLNIGSDRYTDEGVRFIRITDLDDWGILSSENGKYLIESDVGDEFLLNKYDLLLCRSGHTVGKSYLHLLNGKYTSGGYLVRFNFGNYYSSKFIFYITKTHFYCNWIFINTIISTIENVNGEKYSNFDYPKPPLSEQQQIVDYLDSQTQKIDTLIKKENKRIELLKEYRQSLISEAVTGKIDLRDEVAV